MSALTRREILLEYAKCLSDPIYAIEKYLKTYDGTRGIYVPFILFPRQKEIVNAYAKNRFNLVAKPRQAGVSATSAAYCAVLIAFADIESPENILILANKRRMAEEFLKKIEGYLDQIPRWAWGAEYYGTTERENKSIYSINNQSRLSLPNGCEVTAVATSKDAIRGLVPTLLIVDEAAFLDNPEIVMTTAMPSLSTGGAAIFISTPNSRDPLYFKTYEGAKLGKNDFHVIDMRWYEDMRYNKDLKWKKGEKVVPETEFTFEHYEEMIKDGYKPTSSWYENMCRSMNNNARMIAQELDVSFIGSGSNVISEEFIEYHELNNMLQPQWVEGGNREYWIWEQPKEGHEYILASDVSTGNGDDFSTMSIFDITDMEQVMEYCGKIAPDLLGDIIFKYGNLYNAYVVVDTTGGIGDTTIIRLNNLGYKRLHYETEIKKETGDAGFEIKADNRFKMIMTLEQYIREGVIKIRSARVISEMKTFIYKGGRPDHQSGSNDDCLISCAMAFYVLEYSFKNLQKLEKQTKAMLDSWVVGNSKDLDKYNKPTPNNGPTMYPTNNSKSGNSNNLNNHMWLFSGMR